MGQFKMLLMVDYVREIAVNMTCKYGEYGLFEHLLFLFSVVKESLVIEVQCTGD